MPTPKLIYNAKIIDGKVTLDYPVKFKNEVSNAFPDSDITITVEKRKRKRSLNQNAYYFGVVVPLVRNGINQFGNEFSIEETHEYLKANFNLKEVINTNTGEVMKVPLSTANLTTINFMEYIEKIQRFAANDLCIVIPDPNEMYIQLHDQTTTVHEIIKG